MTAAVDLISRRAALAMTAIAALLIVLCAPLAEAQTAPAPLPSEQQLLDLTNATRAERDLPALVANADLAAVARGWTAVMAAQGRMYHNPDLAGQYPGEWTRLGENVGYARWPGQDQANLTAIVHQAFVDSPVHYANIVGDYNQVGIGIQQAADGTLWVTVNFLNGPVPSATFQDDPAVPVPAQVGAAIAVSRELFADGSARHVVLARAEEFADALGGAALAGDGGPVLFTPGPSATAATPGLDSATLDELRRVLPAGSPVYVLGGPAALDATIDTALAAAGYVPTRVAGASRIETALAVADRVVARNGAPAEILLARAQDWADAVTGGAYAADRGIPVLLTGGDQLHPAVAGFLARYPDARVWALGGTAALAAPVVTAAQATRVAGADRTATAVAVAEQLWGRTTGDPGDRFVAVPAYDSVGWAYALAYAPWSAIHDSPQLLVGDTPSPSVLDYLGRLGYSAAVPLPVDAVPSVATDLVTALGSLIAG